MKSSSKAPTLNLQILTWEKESHGLYDYEATKLKKEFFQIQGPCKMFRNWQSAETTIISNDKIKKGLLPNDSFNFVSSIGMPHNGNCQNFSFYPAQRPSQDISKKDGNADQAGPMNTNAYVIVKQYKMNNGIVGYNLNPGNIVKLGRVEYRVVEIGGLPRKNMQKKKDLFLGEFNGVHQANENIAGNCKFCLCDDSTPDNFLISPCKCKGSCQGVHVQCLKMWIDSKVKKQVTGMVVSYNFTKFQCEICKEPFPRMVHRGQRYKMEMITIDKPEKPYIIFQGINERKQSRQQRCLHVICPQNGNVVKMGRGHQCEIRLQDISVSRLHSQIKFLGNEFYICDTNSKFGTLVKLDRQIGLNNKMKLQIGRSVLSFQVE